MANSKPLPISDPLLRRPIVEAMCGIGTSCLYKLMRDGDFPRPLRIAPGAVRWRRSEVQAWIDSRPTAGPVRNAAA